MKTIKLLIVMAIFLGLNTDVHSTEWSGLKFWKKKDAGCVDAGNCVDECASDGCVDSPRGARCKKVISASKQWLAEACNKSRFKRLRSNDCLASCVDDSCVTSHVAADQWVWSAQETVSQNAIVAPQKLSQLDLLNQKVPVQVSDATPAPRVVPTGKIKKYYPVEDATGFLAPIRRR
ncbi:MAG: hypothetical protein JKY95_17540 [Planctomycetaceae bacterium]|nr:hypothetical protein [Planctomycetaceae bacterium]